MLSSLLRVSCPLLPQLKNKFMKKIPRDAEASNVLIGEVDFLEKPFVSFVRLAQATTLGGLTEVPVPTRCVCCWILPLYRPSLPLAATLLFL